MTKKIIFLLLFLILFSYVYANRYYIKTDGNDQDAGTSWQTAFKTFNRAMSIALSGDDVWVAKGTYQQGNMIEIYEGVSFYGGFVGTEETLDERDIQNNQTIIDGNKSYRCVTNNGRIDGFYITKGYDAQMGGGIYNDGGESVNCFVYDNSASYYDNINSYFYGNGGGIYNKSGNVINCTVYQNFSLVSGSGIYNYQGTITNCDIFQNHPGMISDIIYNKGGTIISCDIYDNYGTGVGNYSGIIKNCKIFNNTSGGVDNEYGIVVNCLVFGNERYSDGGGISNYKGTIVNCTVYGNSTYSSGGGIINGSQGSVINCISWNNIAGDIIGSGTVTSSCFYEATDGVNGNIKGNPFFVNTYGDISTLDFHLQNGSPCIDKGTLIGSNIPTDDIEGNLRPGGDGKICIGAYESPDDYEPGEPLPPQRFYVSSAGDDTSGLSWQTAFNSLTKSLKVASRNDEIWVAEGTYSEGHTIVIIDHLSLYGGFSGTETSSD